MLVYIAFQKQPSHQLLHYLDVNLDKYADTVVFRIGISDILNSASNVNGLLSNKRYDQKMSQFWC